MSIFKKISEKATRITSDIKKEKFNSQQTALSDIPKTIDCEVLISCDKGKQMREQIQNKLKLETDNFKKNVDCDAIKEINNNTSMDAFNTLEVINKFSKDVKKSYSELSKTNSKDLEFKPKIECEIIFHKDKRQKGTINFIRFSDKKVLITYKYIKQNKESDKNKSEKNKEIEKNLSVHIDKVCIGGNTPGTSAKDCKTGGSLNANTSNPSNTPPSDYEICE